jgi:iron complex outermembrane receptor protein
VKLGLTPNDSDEYVVGFMKQEGSKGQPVSTDLTSSARYWQWPTWDIWTAIMKPMPPG